MSTTAENLQRKTVPVFIATTVMLSFISFWRVAAIVLADLGPPPYLTRRAAPKGHPRGDAVQLRRAPDIRRVQQYVWARRRVSRGQRGHGWNAGQVFRIGPALR